MIHLAGPVVLAAALAGAGVYGLLARRNVVLVLVGAELLLNAAGLLLVTANALPAGGLRALSPAGQAAQAARAGQATAAGDQAAQTVALMSGQVMTIVLVTIAAAEIGIALAVVLLLFRRRATSDLTQVRELGEASPTYTDYVADDYPADVQANAQATAQATAQGRTP